MRDTPSALGLPGHDVVAEGAAEADAGAAPGACANACGGAAGGGACTAAAGEAVAGAGAATAGAGAAGAAGAAGWVAGDSTSRTGTVRAALDASVGDPVDGFVDKVAVCVACATWSAAVVRWDTIAAKTANNATMTSAQTAAPNRMDFPPTLT